MKRKALLLVTCAAGVLGAGQTLAQAGVDDREAAVPTAQRAREAAAKSGVVVEELVVTAKEATQDLQTVPVAVTAYTAEQRNLTALNTLDDLVNMTPGTTISANGINMRGVGRQTSETSALGSDPGVAYYVNGFYNVVASNVGESTLYSESIQFERGPQGTRFGRNAIAGTASLWARRPTKELQGQAVLQYGDNGFFGAGVNVAGPINDRYGVRFGWQHFATDKSVQKNIYPTKAGLAVENNYFEFQIEGRPTDNLHFWLRSTTFQFQSDPGYSAPPAYNTTAPMGALVPNPTFAYATPAPTDPRAINVDTKGADRLSNNMVHILNADYDFGSVTLEYVGGFAQFDAYGYSDGDRAGRISYVACTPSATVTCAAGTVPNSGFPNNRVISTRQVNAYDNRNQYFTHELRLRGNDTGKVDWVVGAFYLNSNYNEFFHQSLPDEAALDAPILSFTTFAPAAPNPDRDFYSQRNIRKTRSVAGFGDVIYHLSDRWDVIAGLRYSVESARATTQIRYVFFNPAFVMALDSTPATSRNLFKLRNEEWSGRLGVDFHATDDTLLYAKYSRGFKAGGFNLGNVTTTTNNVTKPEILDSFEFGLKQRFGNTLSGDATVFYYDYKDLQIPLTGFNPTTGTTFSQFTNVDKARIFGLEMQGTWRPIEPVWINFNYTYLDAESRKFCCAVDLTQVPSVPQALDGKRLPRTPKHKLGAAGAYTFDFDPGSLILGANATYTSSQYQSPLENKFLKIPDFTLVNASVTWRSADNRYDLIGQVSNVFDVDRVTSLELFGNNTTAGGVTASKLYGAPRFWQVQLRYRW
ncbi:MAG: TonB-dependent receptor [Alphaproteobacteria bacterium]|nr:TonB-dependent receptor [Alphaproteobacteria bacterium]MBU1516411.1 TonB-dependent receptor [Alphaproteobacteria bacterium]MBU2093352.1 TonB-dependent receptor [Alphaproteobacteria bacterium]MBU2153839.1 TonB-dependent receptor [Alphaproteobacteria bacterium]MBU2307711.1 TonB-dependent receptor [Alphaproteobacteria bacterium]